MNDMVDGFCLLLAAIGWFVAFVFAWAYRRADARLQLTEAALSNQLSNHQLASSPGYGER